MIRNIDDANHVAIAVTNGIGYFCSWDFTLMVKVNTRREVNLINALKGYGPIEIIAPHPKLFLEIIAHCPKMVVGFTI